MNEVPTNHFLQVDCKKEAGFHQLPFLIFQVNIHNSLDSLEVFF